jgi:hypothetical protein
MLPGFAGTPSPGKTATMKAKCDDHVITVRRVLLPAGREIPAGTHGFVIEAFETLHETYEEEFDLDDAVPGLTCSRQAAYS